MSKPKNWEPGDEIEFQASSASKWQVGLYEERAPGGVHWIRTSTGFPLCVPTRRIRSPEPQPDLKKGPKK
jgi:hypothetical protein